MYTYYTFFCIISDQCVSYSHSSNISILRHSFFPCGCNKEDAYNMRRMPMDLQINITLAQTLPVHYNCTLMHMFFSSNHLPRCSAHILCVITSSHTHTESSNACRCKLYTECFVWKTHGKTCVTRTYSRE